MTDEYISKQRAKDLMGCCLASAKAQYKAEKNEFKKARYGDYISTIQAMIDVVGAVEAADVQPFKWVRCEETLPVYDGLVLVADRDNNIRLGIFTETGWLSQFGNPMMARPKAWAKIPELPEPWQSK